MKEKNRSVNFSPINAVSYSSPKNIQQKNYIMMEITRTKKARVNPPFKDQCNSHKFLGNLPGFPKFVFPKKKDCVIKSKFMSVE